VHLSLRSIHAASGSSSAIATRLVSFKLPIRWTFDVSIDSRDGLGCRDGYHYRGRIEKTRKAETVSNESKKKEPPKVTTGVFQDRLLCSRVDAAGRPGEMGKIFNSPLTRKRRALARQLFDHAALTTTQKSKGPNIT
jgi:hypothetical protein